MRRQRRLEVEDNGVGIPPEELKLMCMRLTQELLVLDESVSMRDEASRDEILQFLDDYHTSAHSIIHVTPDYVEEIKEDKIFLLIDGELLFFGDKTCSSYCADIYFGELVFRS